MRIRDVNVSSSGMTDKTMGRFYSVAAFVKLVFSKHSSRRDYGLNARRLMQNAKYLDLVSVLKTKPNTLIITARKIQRHTHIR